MKSFYEKITTEIPGPLVVNTHTLRAIIGLLGISLPLAIMVVTNLSATVSAEPTISHYYHTAMRDLFVGICVAVGVALCCYTGYNKLEQFASIVTGMSAALLALFPTNVFEGSASITECETIFYLFNAGFTSKLHYIFAAIFFLGITFFSFQFTRSNKPESQQTAEKHIRNNVYKASASIILACLIGLVAIFALGISGHSAITGYYVVFILEALAILFFSVSWLTKSEIILGDR